jgi:hypothetical protein
MLFGTRKQRGLSKCDKPGGKATSDKPTRSSNAAESNGFHQEPPIRRLVSSFRAAPDLNRDGVRTMDNRSLRQSSDRYSHSSDPTHTGVELSTLAFNWMRDEEIDLAKRCRFIPWTGSFLRSRQNKRLELR